MHAVYFQEVTVKSEDGQEYTVSKAAYDAITSSKTPIFKEGIRILKADAHYDYEQHEWSLALSVARLLLKANAQDPSDGVDIVQDAFNMERAKAFFLLEEAIVEKSRPLDI